MLQDEDLRQVTLKEPASFRWLSLGAAVKAVWECYPALALELEQEVASGVDQAKGLYDRIRNVKFVLACAFLMDIMPVLDKLS